MIAIDGRQASRSWERIFVDDLSYFRPDIERISVLAGADANHLTRKQYEALVAAAHSVGDERYYLSIVEGGVEWVDSQHAEMHGNAAHWRSSFDDYNDYYNHELHLAYTMHSPSGQWGVHMTDSDIALVGGTRAFMDELIRLNPEVAMPAQELRWWYQDDAQEWVSHVLGLIRLGDDRG